MRNVKGIAFYRIDRLTRKSWLIASLACALIGQSCWVARAQEGERPLFVPNQLSITYKSQNDADEAMAEIASGTTRGAPATGLTVTRTNGTTLTILFEFATTRGGPTAELDRLQEIAAALLASDPRIETAGPVWIYYNPRGETGDIDSRLKSQIGEQFPTAKTDGARDFIVDKDGPNDSDQGAPNDQFFFLQWDYLRPPRGMNAIGAWKITHGNPEIVVAVIDTGILPDHPDMRGSGNIVRGRSFVTSRQNEKQFCNDEPTWGGPATDPGDERSTCPPNRATAAKPEPSFHGTHVAGTIGAVKTNNKVGIAGVAWNVTVLPLRVLTAPGGRGSELDIIDAMKWAAGLSVEGLPPNDHPADIISMSLGRPNFGLDGKKSVFATCDQNHPYSRVLSEIRKRGTVVVVAAGNGELQTADGSPCFSENNVCTNKPIDVKYALPAGCPGVISVAASDMHGQLAPYSNYGAVSITAPGGNLSDFGDVVGTDGKIIQRQAPYGGILSSKGDSYTWYQGTSMAAPHVAGAIALLLSAHPEFRHKPEMIEKAIRASAVPPPDGGCPSNKPCGPGLLDAAKLVGSQPSNSGFLTPSR